MPSTTSSLAACEKEFNEARAALAAAQRANRDAPDAETPSKLAAARERFVAAGQALRREKDPERALDIVEYQRHLAAKAKAVAAKRAKGAG